MKAIAILGLASLVLVGCAKGSAPDAPAENNLSPAQVEDARKAQIEANKKAMEDQKAAGGQ